MNQHLQQTLAEKFPKILTKNDQGRHPYDLFGIECDDGWYDLLFKLCTWIQHHIDHSTMDGKSPNQVTALQIKEKYGALRFYTSGGDQMIQGAIDFAEYQSQFICELTGLPGELCCSETGWYKTLCTEKQNQMEFRPASQLT